MISHRNKCIFIHIPRTGGSTIERQIWWPNEFNSEYLHGTLLDGIRNKYQTGGLQHLLANQVRREVGEKTFREYWKFAIIRNPWEKAASQFAWMRGRLRSPRGQNTRVAHYIGLKRSDCFKTYLDLIRKKEHVQWIPQHRFILNENGDPLVDHIGRYENYEGELRKISEKLRLNLSPTFRLNESDRGPMSIYYDRESVEIVRQMYAWDIEMFNYKPQFGIPD